MTRPGGQKREYIKLEEIIGMLPVSEPVEVNTYGIINAYNKQTNEIKLMDETRTNHTVIINTLYDPNHVRKTKKLQNKVKGPIKNKSYRLPCKTGDIIRIHHLFLQRNLTCQSFKPADLVVFRNFKEKALNPMHLSSNPSFSSDDEERVKQLSELSVKQLLSAEVKLFPSTFNHENFLVANLAFQVLAVQPLDKSHIIVCWNGKPFTKYPCHQSVSLDIIFHKLHLSRRTSEIYTEEFVRQLYEAEKLVFITVYGDVHRLTANKLKALDVIAIYNLIIKPDKFFYGKYSYLMFESDKYGRAIRWCSPKSKMSTELLRQIEHDFYFDDDISLDISKISAPSRLNNAEEKEKEAMPQ